MREFNYKKVTRSVLSFFFNSLKGKLIVFAVLVGIIPALLVGGFSYFAISESMRNAAIEKLQLANTLTNQRLTAYFEALAQQVNLAARSKIVHEALADYEKAFEADGRNIGSNWVEQNANYHTELTGIKEQFGYQDIFLVTTEGNIVYTNSQSEDLGQNFISGSYNNSSAAKCFNDSLSANSITDFEPYTPAENKPCGFAGAPIQDGDGKTIGAFMIVIPYGQINQIAQNATGMGETGETYIVGQDKRLRSDSRLDELNSVVNFSLLNKTVDTESSGNALAGKEGLAEIVNYSGHKVFSAYSPMNYGNLGWATISEIHEEEVYSAVNSFLRFFLIAMAVVLAVVIIVGFFVSGLIANPLLSIVPVAHAVAEGDVSQQVKLITRDEVGKVARAFNAVIAYMKEMASAADKIAQGDLTAEVEPKSERDVLGNSFVQVIGNLRELSSSVDMMTRAAIDGNLDVRGEVNKFNGDYARIVKGINDTLDALIGPLRMASVYIDNIARGMKQNPVTEEYRGEFNNIKNNLNKCIAAFNALVEEMMQIIEAAKGGMLDVRADADRCEGVYKKILLGFNSTLDSITVPLAESAEVLYRQADYDLTTKVMGNYKGDLSLLKDAMNDALDNQLTVVMELKKVSAELAESSSQLTRASEQAGQATQQIAMSSQQVARGASDQASALQDTLQSVEQLAKAIDQIARGAQEQSRIIEKNVQVVSQVSAAITQISANAQKASEGAKVAADSAEHGAEMTQDTVRGMENIRVTMDKVASKVNGLGERSKEIGKIISAIEEIADQTNLLALNAAVEAARAGEQGRGFAVVADEVRKLAEKASEATKEIANLITGIQDGVVETVSAMEKGAREVADGYEMASKAGGALEEILSKSREIRNQIEQISEAGQQLNGMSSEMVKLGDNISAIVEQNTAATEEMAATAKQVSKSVEEVAGVAEENSAATEEVSAAAEEISAQVQQVVVAGGSLSHMAEVFKGLVAKYKLNGNGHGTETVVAAAGKNPGADSTVRDVQRN